MSDFIQNAIVLVSSALGFAFAAQLLRARLDPEWGKFVAYGAAPLAFVLLWFAILGRTGPFVDSTSARASCLVTTGDVVDMKGDGEPIVTVPSRFLGSTLTVERQGDRLLISDGEDRVPTIVDTRTRQVRQPDGKNVGVCTANPPEDR